jgi:hypothetical protein
MRRPAALLTAALLLLPGCARLSDSTFQKINVVTPGVIGAECELTTENNRYRVLTPERIAIQRSAQPLDVDCRKAQYKTALLTVPYEDRTGFSVLGNLWNGILPGLAYDVASQSVYAYPDTIVVPMEKDLDAVARGALPTAAPATPLEKKPAPAPEPVVDPTAQPASESLQKALRK